MLADDVMYIHSTAVAETKDGYLAGLGNGLYEYVSIESDEVAVRFCGDIAIQTGKVWMLVGARGQPKAPVSLFFTLVWKREPRGWRLWQRHATRIAGPG
jgi:ketosteroid isomerase-like protein